MKTKQGGTRKGAGRPEKAEKKTTYSTKLRPDQKAFLRSLKNAGGFLEEIIDHAIADRIRIDPETAARAKADSVPMDMGAPRIMAWACSCGVKNRAPVKGASVACSVCKIRLSTGNKGLIITKVLKNRVAAALVTLDPVFIVMDWGVGCWVSDILDAEPGTTLPWSDRVPRTQDGVLNYNKLFT